MSNASTPSADPLIRVPIDYNNIVDAQFLRRLVDQDLNVVHGDGWITTAGSDGVPGKLLASANYSRAERLELLIELPGAIAQLVFWDLMLHVRVAARDKASCIAALEELRRTFPADVGADEEVPVTFWWWQPDGPGEMGRRMPAPAWEAIEGNYAGRTLDALKPLMAWKAPPASGGRLMLWHGEPGTGKTTAIRALARQWRDWADFQFITDPEYFLQMPSYLLSTIAESGRPPGSKARWRVLVLEDTGEYLAPDAKHMTGQALSRLLNVCDGALGQATRSLVLATTNESLHALHPALARHGRCLAQVEFHELAAEEIARWCRACEISAPGLQRATLADLFAHAEGRELAEPKDSFGFAAAA